MKSRAELKTQAKIALGGQIFSNNWMLALAACLIVSAITSAVSALLYGIASLIITGPFSYGVAKTFLVRARGEEKYEIGNIFKGFTDDFGGTLLIGLMTGIFTFLWSLLLIVPGIVKAYSYSMAYYIKVDNPTYTWKECIDASKELTNGHKLELFVLDLSFIGWSIVGMLCLGVGILWVIPYMNATRAEFYKELVATERYFNEGCSPEA